MRHIKPFPNFTAAERADLAIKINKALVLRDAPAWVGEGEPPEWTKHPCMIHMGKWEDGKGYRKIKFKGHTLYVHRANWVLFHGHDVPAETPILDHLCRVRRCAQPHHFEPVTVKENNFRGNGNWVYGQGADLGPGKTCPGDVRPNPVAGFEAIISGLPPEDQAACREAYALGGVKYGGKSWRDAEILTHAIEHGDPRFVPLVNRDVIVPPTHDGGTHALLLASEPAEAVLPPDQDGRKRTIRVHGVSAPKEAGSFFPRRLRLFFNNFLNKFAGVP